MYITLNAVLWPLRYSNCSNLDPLSALKSVNETELMSRVRANRYCVGYDSNFCNVERERERWYGRNYDHKFAMTEVEKTGL